MRDRPDVAQEAQDAAAERRCGAGPGDLGEEGRDEARSGLESKQDLFK